MARRQSEVRGSPRLRGRAKRRDSPKKREFVIICLAVGFVGIAKQTLHEQGNGPFHIVPLRPADDTAPPSNGDNMTGAAGGNVSVSLAPLSFLPPFLHRLLLEQSRVDNLWSSGVAPRPSILQTVIRGREERKNMISLS